MAELRTLARPYAQAVFELAQSQNRLAEWSQALNTLAAIIRNDDVAALIGNPGVATDELARAIADIAGDALDDEGRNLVQLATENNRLPLLPEVAAQFHDLRLAAEGRVDVEVTSAAELSDEQQQQLSKALHKRLQREISLSCVTDPALIGGFVVRAGDLVIDGSLRASLARLQQNLGR